MINPLNELSSVYNQNIAEGCGCDKKDEMVPQGKTPMGGDGARPGKNKKGYVEPMGEGLAPGDVDQKVGAVTSIPKKDQDAAKQRLLAKAKAKREAMKEGHCEEEGVKCTPVEKKKDSKKSMKEHTSWRRDLREVLDNDEDSDESDKQIKEKKVKNKIKINPPQGMTEGFAEIGGVVLEMYEITEEPDKKVVAQRAKNIKKIRNKKETLATLMRHAKDQKRNPVLANSHELDGDSLDEGALDKSPVEDPDGSPTQKKLYRKLDDRRKRDVLLKKASNEKEARNKPMQLRPGESGSSYRDRVQVQKDKQSETDLKNKIKSGQATTVDAARMRAKKIQQGVVRAIAGKVDEAIDLKKADMGEVIKDFRKSDAPQFKGKSDKKKQQMAIAAKLQADEGFDMSKAPSIKDAKPAKKTNVKYDPHMKVMAPTIKAEKFEPPYEELKTVKNEKEKKAKLQQQTKDHDDKMSGRLASEETISERTRYAKETGKDYTTGKPSVKGGEEPPAAMKYLQKSFRDSGGMMSSRRKAIQPQGKKKVPGKKGYQGTTPVDKIRNRLAQKRAEKPDPYRARAGESD